MRLKECGAMPGQLGCSQLLQLPGGCQVPDLHSAVALTASGLQETQSGLGPACNPYLGGNGSEDTRFGLFRCWGPFRIPEKEEPLESTDAPVLCHKYKPSIRGETETLTVNLGEPERHP